jgi:predicted nucleotidyltransferase
MDEYASRLFSTHAEVEEVIVFGSFAEGCYGPGSDLDVFIVLSTSDKPLHDRIPELLPDGFPVPLDLFPFTPEEIAARRPSALLDAVDSSTWRYKRHLEPKAGGGGKR